LDLNSEDHTLISPLEIMQLQPLVENHKPLQK